MSQPMLSPLRMNAPEFLSSHSSPRSAPKSYSRSDMSRQAASRLVYISDWKLNKESARDEPRLRRLLGHLSVNEQTTEFVQSQTPAPVMVSLQQKQHESNELSAYLQYVPLPVPSFRDFQAAIETQIATMVQITAASAARLNFVGKNNNNNNRDMEDDSDHDSYDDYQSDGDTDTSSAAGSDDSSDNSSFTTDDNDDSLASSESDCGNVSGSDRPFRSSCSCSRKGELIGVCGEQDDEDDETESLWALRPLTTAPLMHIHPPQAITTRC
ncbi:hypothetical protein ABEF95_000428 [Exophiala dermatitidis]